MCKPLTPDVVTPKAHQNSYGSSADLPLDSLCKNLAWLGGYTENLKKNNNTKLSKLGGGCLRVWALARDNTIYVFFSWKRSADKNSFCTTAIIYTKMTTK